MRLGSNLINKIYIGNIPVNSVRKGSSLIFLESLVVTTTAAPTTTTTTTTTTTAAPTTTTTTTTTTAAPAAFNYVYNLLDLEYIQNIGHHIYNSNYDIN